MPAVTGKQFVRVEDDDPKRCQCTAGKKQCSYQACKGSKYCPLHSGKSIQEKVQQKRDIEQYQVAKYQQRLKELGDHPKLKSLRDEVAILRMTLEAVLAKCNSQTDLFLNANKIIDLAAKIEKLVVSCQSVEMKAGNLLDKTQLLSIVDQILNIITNHIDDPDVLREISEQVVVVLEG